MASGMQRLEELCAGALSPDDVVATEQALNSWAEPVRMRCTPPFLVKWYNQSRQDTAGGASLIDAPENALAFALYSIPGFVDIVAEHFARSRPKSDCVDNATNEILEALKASLPSDVDALVVNTNDGPPFYHAQSMGAVSCADQNIEESDFGEEAAEWREELQEDLAENRDQKMWGTDPATLRKIYGVNMHPIYGGWYSYRALVVFRGVTAEGLPRREPMQFLEPSEARRIISEYNLAHEECRWRDLTSSGHPAEHRYTPEEYYFFMESKPKKRERYLELRAACMPAPPALRV